MKVHSPDWQTDPRYGTASWPEPIQTPNHNGPRAAQPRTVSPRPFNSQDGRTAAQHLLDQQWRDAVALGLLHNSAAAINSTGPA